MHTVRCSDRRWGGVYLPRGCTCRGCTCLGGVPAWGYLAGAGYLLGGVPARGGCTRGCTCLGVYLPGGVPAWVVYLLEWGVPARGVYLPRGGLPTWGVYLPRGWCTCPGVYLWGVSGQRVHLQGVGVCIPACTEADTPLLWTEWWTGVETLHLKMCESTICTILEFFNLCHRQLEMK